MSMLNNILLSENEILFLKLVCGELTYKEIAFEMGLSPRTIENYRNVLFDKLNIRSRTVLVRFAIKNGLVSGDAFDNS
jgi:DNA-binding NarL/FixJ family response regulator